MEEYRLDREDIVVPQRHPVEGMLVARIVAELFVSRRIAVDDPGRYLPRQTVRALDASVLRRIEQHLDVVCEQKVVVVEEVEPFAAGFGERDVAGASAAYVRPRCTVAHV
jgi:hypothetical protein